MNVSNRTERLLGASKPDGDKSVSVTNRIEWPRLAVLPVLIESPLFGVTRKFRVETLFIFLKYNLSFQYLCRLLSGFYLYVGSRELSISVSTMGINQVQFTKVIISLDLEWNQKIFGDTGSGSWKLLQNIRSSNETLFALRLFSFFFMDLVLLVQLKKSLW